MRPINFDLMLFDASDLRVARFLSSALNFWSGCMAMARMRRLVEINCIRCCASAMLVMCMMVPVSVADVKSEPLPLDPTRDSMFLAAGFLRQHPDLIYRKYGMDALAKQDYSGAMRFFRKAAYYADKPSQGMIAELLWLGIGGEQDRPAAYAWMDLAAEREYYVFVVQREKYWLDMSAAERKQSIAVGEALYATYGDDQAKARLSLALRWEQKKAVGSRLGGFAGASAQVGTLGNGEGDLSNTIDGSKFYDPQFWNPEKYWEYTDKVWNNVGKKGKVTVGDMERVTDAQFKDAENSVKPTKSSKD